ncbi:DUF2235 domain-containing protein, partial [Tropicimonas sp.]|uniref:DUF2235 domain-containing protein n=1 Tax=Tropicimonas sp. TaxID=2067044 RepID=UPI003A879A9C
MRLERQFAAWRRLRRRNRHRESAVASRLRGPVTHVVVLDGTMSNLVPGQETNAALTYKLLAGEGPRAGLSLYYDAGVQWANWSSTGQVITGRGLNRKIRAAYGFLASRYRPGDRIFLFGYSRGAFAVRSLAGCIDRIGLLTARNATVRNIRQAYRHYQYAPQSPAAHEFTRALCHIDVSIEMIGVWDTVKALGLPLPLLWRFVQPAHAFHNHMLGAHVRRGYHALAHDETRIAFAPELWETTADTPGDIEQRWFPGAHGDVGGQLGGFEAARPLANLSLVWMLDKAEGAGLDLPPGWRGRFACDAGAPSVGTWRGWGKMFWFRHRRRIG